MEIVADVMLAAGAFGAAVYCMVLSRRLGRFARLEGGMGEAIAVLSAQVDDLTRVLARAQSAATGSTDALRDLTARAEATAARLELVLAALNDAPAAPEPAAEDVAASDRRPRIVRRRGRAEAAE